MNNLPLHELNVALLTDQLARGRDFVRQLLMYGRHDLHCIQKWKQELEGWQQTCDCGYSQLRDAARAWAERT